MKLFRPGGFARRTAMLATGTAIGQGIYFLAWPILSRLYNPSDFGAFAVYFGIVSVLASIATLRYEDAVVVEKDDQTAADVLKLCGVVALLTSLSAGAVIWLIRHSIAQWTSTPGVRDYLWLVAASTLGAGAYRALSMWAIRRDQYARVAQTKISQGIGMTVTQIGLGAANVGSAGLMIGDVIGWSGGSIYLARMLWRRDRALLRGLCLARLREVSRRYIRFPIFASGGAMLNALGLQLPFLLIASFYGPHTAGSVAFAHRALTIPLVMVAAAVGQVYLRRASRAIEDGKAAMLQLLWRVVLGMLVISVPYVVVVSLLSIRWFGVVFGADWVEAGTYVPILAPLAVMLSVVGPTGYTLSVVERQELLVVRELVRVLIVSGAGAIAGALNCEPAIAVAILSCGGCLGYVFYIATTVYAIKSSTGPPRAASLEGN